MTIEDVCKLPRVAYENRGETPKRAGVYFVLIEAPSLKIIYIGATSCLRYRLSGHSRAQDFSSLQFLGVPVFVSWKEFDPEKRDMEAIESNLIFQFNPPLNRQIPSESKQEADRFVLQDRRSVKELREKYASFRERGTRNPTKRGVLTEDVKRSVSNDLKVPLEGMTIRELRRVASQLHVVNYSRSKWIDLVDAIKVNLGDFYQR